MDKNRKELYEKIEELRESKLLVYVTSDRKDYGAEINDDAINYISKHLDNIGNVNKISLYLYTLGGDVLAAWNIVNLIRQFCNELEIIVPWKARSAGTLMCLGANNIIMTKQATLGPIDPSIININVEEVQGFLELAKNELNIKDDIALSNIYNVLANQIHPLLLGKAYRTRSQIQMLARKLLKYQLKDDTKINNIISFLCSESGSHDYTINSKEAKDDLCLNIIEPNDDLYKLIKEIHSSISEELGLSNPYNIKLPFITNIKEENIIIKKIIIESMNTDSDYYIYVRIRKGVEDTRLQGKEPMTDKSDIGDYINYQRWISRYELDKMNNYSDYII